MDTAYQAVAIILAASVPFLPCRIARFAALP